MTLADASHGRNGADRQGSDGSNVTRYGSGGPYEDVFGYSRVVVAGPWALTAGSTSTVDGEVAHVGDAHAQTKEAFGIALDALARIGVTRDQVVRTRMYVTDMAAAASVGRAHGEVFGGVRPVATMVGITALVHQDLLVEVEVEAYLGGSRPSS